MLAGPGVFAAGIGNRPGRPGVWDKDFQFAMLHPSVEAAFSDLKNHSENKYRIQSKFS
jgi:hypothetical protein